MTDFTSALGGTFIDPFTEYKRVKNGGGGSGASAGGAAVGAVGRGMTGMTTAVVKGTLVDVPLALTEGLKQTSKLIGDDVRDHGKVSDWKSGGTVAAKVRPFITFHLH